MRMSMPSGMRFHLSSRDWPLGRLKPHPLNHGVLWGDNAHGSGSGTGLHSLTFLTHIHPRLAMLSLPFWWLALAAGCFSVDCFKTKPFESRHGAYKLFNWKEHRSLNSGDLPGRLLTKRWQCFFSPQTLLLPKIASPGPQHCQPPLVLRRWETPPVLPDSPHYCRDPF